MCKGAAGWRRGGGCRRPGGLPDSKPTLGLFAVEYFIKRCGDGAFTQSPTNTRPLAKGASAVVAMSVPGRWTPLRRHHSVHRLEQKRVKPLRLVPSKGGVCCWLEWTWWAAPGAGRRGAQRTRRSLLSPTLQTRRPHPWERTHVCLVKAALSLALQRGLHLWPPRTVSV